MDKTLLKKSGILAGLLLVLSISLGLLISYISTRRSTASGIGVIIGAMLVGQIYAINFKEIMPKKLRINVTIIYILAQTVLGSLYILVFGVPNLGFPFGIYVIVMTLVYPFLIYWVLGSGGKTYLKALQKREAAKK